MRSFWSRVPMLRIMFAALTGICAAIAAMAFTTNSLPLIYTATTLLSAPAAFIIAAGFIKNAAIIYKIRLWTGAALNLLIFAAACLLTLLHAQVNYNTYFSRFIAGNDVLVATINEPPIVKDKVVMATATINEVNNSAGSVQTCGNLQLTFLRDSLCSALQYGNVLLLKSRIDTTSPPKNPNEFDFKTYLGYHNIYHKTFATQHDWKLLPGNNGNLVMAFIYHVRSHFLSVISNCVTDKNDFGVASAIMLGYRDYINADIMRAYASSGTVHVLSVSGLHVSIMFFMLNFLFSWMDKRNRNFTLAKTAIIIGFIWFYACLTGLSAPVLRSALMFTLIQAGFAFIRNVNTYNIIAASALLQMLFDPFVVADVGFQLSYLAVFGIVYLQPKIAKLHIIKLPQGPIYKKQKQILLKPIYFLRFDLKWLAAKLFDLTWQLIAASLAAQISTLPLCLFYFYQFPSLFLLANIVVIPLSNLLLFAGTTLFVVSKIPVLNFAAAWLFSHLLHLLNVFIFRIDSLPFALIKGISLSVAEVILCYLLIIQVCWLTEERKNKLLITSLAIVLVLCSFSSYKSFEHKQQKQVVVYSVSKQKAIAFINGQNLFYDFDSTLMADENSLQFHIYHNWYNLGIETEKAISNTGTTMAPGIYCCNCIAGRLVLFEGKKILVVDSSAAPPFNGMPKKLKVDLVIFSGTLNTSLPTLYKTVDFADVVFDSRCQSASRKRWKKDCANLNLRYWDVNADGAFVWNLV